MVEDEQLAPTRHVRDDALAHELVDEVAAQAPQLGRRVHLDPAAPNRRAVVAIVLPRLGQQPRSRGAGRSGPSGSRRRRRPGRTRRRMPVSSMHLADGRLLDGLALLDAAAGNDRRCTRARPGSRRRAARRVPVSGCSRVTYAVTGGRGLSSSRPSSWPCAPASSPGTSRASRGSPRRRASDGTASSPSAAGTPNRFQSTADSALIFMSPNPGRPEMRFLRSSASDASRQSLDASPPYSSSTSAARSCTRVAIEPGKRCTAGFSRNAASTWPGSRCAISSVPRRSLILSGPANAVWTGTCWSSAKPISSASGSEARSSFASSLFVK